MFPFSVIIALPFSVIITRSVLGVSESADACEDIESEPGEPRSVGPVCLPGPDLRSRNHPAGAAVARPVRTAGTPAGLASMSRSMPNSRS